MVETADLTAFASDASFSIDSRHAIVGWNVAAQRLLGYEPAEAVGRQCADILQFAYGDGDPLCRDGCEPWKCFERDRPFGARFAQARCKNGERIAVSVSSVVLPRRTQRCYTGATVAIIFMLEQELRQDQSHQDKLKIFSLGNFRLAAGKNPIPVGSWQRKQSVSLLKYLAAHLGQPVHREILIEQFWPDTDEARGRKRLKVLIYFLRHELHAAGVPGEVLETEGKNYRLNPEIVWVDALAFENLVIEAARLRGRQQWQSALSCYEEARGLYQGDYMANDIFADWCAAERARLREIYLEMLAGIVDCHTAFGRDRDAIQACRLALVCEPLREDFHHRLIECFVRIGDGAAAIAQYETCRHILTTELGVEPRSDTQRLYQQIVAGNASQPVKHPIRPTAD